MTEIQRVYDSFVEAVRNMGYGDVVVCHPDEGRFELVGRSDGR